MYVAYSFNSKLVRLKEGLRRAGRKVIDGFNSKLVRLKEGRILPTIEDMEFVSIPNWFD